MVPKIFELHSLTVYFQSVGGQQVSLDSAVNAPSDLGYLCLNMRLSPFSPRLALNGTETDSILNVPSFAAEKVI